MLIVNLMYILVNQAAFDILGFKVLRKTGEPLGYSAWLPESTMRALGLDYDCTQIDFDNGSYIQFVEL